MEGLFSVLYSLYPKACPVVKRRVGGNAIGFLISTRAGRCVEVVIDRTGIVVVDWVCGLVCLILLVGMPCYTWWEQADLTSCSSCR